MKIHYFQRYHEKENVATANTMLLLSRLYQYSSDKFFRLLKSGFFGDSFEPELTFKLQEKCVDSVPDAVIAQESFKIVVETKMSDWFYTDQLMRHLKSFSDERYKVLLTLAPEHMAPEKRAALETRLEEYNKVLLYPVRHINVLDISRIESGKIKFAPIPTDITEVTDTVLSIMYGFLSNRDITFHTDLAMPETPYVLADAVRIREVLVNILGNAVKFTDDGGTITFESRYHPGGDAQHITVRYRIADTGVGMSEDFVAHIFDEFSQEESSARTHYKGTGLGMAISKRYVELMGGTISVESKKGEGSTFTVELPLELTDESRVQKSDHPAVNADLVGVKILLAEDNDLNAEIAMVQLEELGIRVTRASNGREAVKIFSDHAPGTFDMIFMDIMMPEMNGYCYETIRYP